MHRPARRFAKLCLLFAAAAVVGCRTGPALIEPGMQKPIDRAVVEYPPNVQLTVYAEGLTAPSAIAFDYDEGDHKGTMVVAESGRGGYPARLYGFTPEGKYFDIYPRGLRPRLPDLPFDIGKGPFEMDGPIGGIVISGGKIFVTHRDRNDRGVVTAFNYDGTHSTVMADLPAQGEFGMTDIAVRPLDGRLYFGVGAMTNSGVVGLDDWAIGWVVKHPQACDLPLTTLKLYGYRFDTKNPLAGLFGPDETAVTAPFQPFNVSNRLRIVGNDKPTGAIYSVSPSGGDGRVEATGLRDPRGIIFDSLSNMFFTDEGMELRGTRPVKDDPDAMFRLYPGAFYGFPDYSRDLHIISDPTRNFSEPQLLIRSGYPELAPVIDLPNSGLQPPDGSREDLLKATFPPLSGAARLDIVPSSGPFQNFTGNFVIALGGDRAPFATSGESLKSPIGYKVVRADPLMNAHAVSNFVYNTSELPAHLLHGRDRDVALERPVDVKFGPDGALYILDMGPMRVENGKEKIAARSGRIFRLGPPIVPSTKPAATDPRANGDDRIFRPH